MPYRGFIFYTFFFAILSTPYLAWSAEASCHPILELSQDLQTKISQLSPIPRSKKQPEPFEIFEPGVLLKTDQKLTEEAREVLRQDGTYNYTIFKNGDLRFSRRIQVVDSQLFMASHRGHIDACLKLAGADCQVAMAGEFLLFNSVVTEVNNRSGTFPNLEAERPKLAYAWLKNAGIPMDPENVLLFKVPEDLRPQKEDGVVIAEQAEAHAKAFKAATFEFKLLRNPRDMRRILVISRIYRLLAKYFPSERQLGGVDIWAALRSERLVSKDLGVAEGSALVIQTVPILGRDSIFQFVWNLKEDEIKKYADGVINQEQVENQVDRKINLMIEEIDHSHLPEKGADLAWIHQAWEP